MAGIFFSGELKLPYMLNVPETLSNTKMYDL